MKRIGCYIIFATLFLAALASGVVKGNERFSLISRWRSASAVERNALLYGSSGPVISKVKHFVPENGRLLLQAGLDPALLPYYLFPRKIWQASVDPETNSVYMDLQDPLFPQRQVDSFNVDWILAWHSKNRFWGGDLTPIDKFHDIRGPQ